MSQKLEQKQQYNKQDYQNTKKEQIKQVMENIVDIFQKEDLPHEIANSFLKSYGIPSDSWSFGNKILMYYTGRTKDARTYNAWLQAGRHVKKGEKAFFISQPSPYRITRKEINKKTGKEEQVEITRMFYKAVAEFAVEQTEGKDVKYVEEPKTLPPLVDVAKKLGAKVKYDRTTRGEQGWTDGIDITLCDDLPDTYFHELVHLAQGKLENKKLNTDRTSEEYHKQEIIAELGACVLADLYGINTKNRAFTYIKSWALRGSTTEKTKEKIGEECLKVFGKVEKILNFIFDIQKEKKS